MPEWQKAEGFSTFVDPSTLRTQGKAREDGDIRPYTRNPLQTFGGSSMLTVVGGGC